MEVWQYSNEYIFSYLLPRLKDGEQGKSGSNEKVHFHKFILAFPLIFGCPHFSFSTKILLKSGQSLSLHPLTPNGFACLGGKQRKRSLKLPLAKPKTLIVNRSLPPPRQKKAISCFSSFFERRFSPRIPDGFFLSPVRPTSIEKEGEKEILPFNGE